jgi:hypothetical protein
MKKLFILFFIITTIKSFGQTYTFNYSYNSQGQKCRDGWHGWKMDILSNTTIQLGENAYNEQYPPNFSFKEYTIKSNPTKFNLEILAYDCTSSINCDPKIKKQTLTFLELLKATNATLWDCPGYQRFAIDNFKPNIYFKNLDNASPNEICAGSQVALAAFPTELLPGNAPDFPAEVYRWSYSLDNGASYNTVPDYIRGKKTNYIATTRFSIQELLGDNHVNYLNKTIYFRLHYGGLPPIPIKYSPCAPTINNVTYEGPKCSGDPIQKVDITFDRPLYPGESLDRIKMKDVTNGIERNERENISIFSTSNPQVYSFSNLVNALENGHTYKIVYQAQMVDPLDPTKKILKGFMESASTLNFTYTDPPKVLFEITNYTEPSCVGGNDGTIEIKVLSGTSPYRFYKDGVELTGPSQPSYANSKYYITGLKAQTHNIMVTDAEGCIEK